MSSSLFYAWFPAVWIVASFFAFGKLLKDPVRARLQGTAMLVGFVAGWMLLGRQPLPLTEGGNGFLWSAVLLTLFIWWSPKPVGARYFVRALFVVAIGALLLWEMRDHLGGTTNLRNLLAFFFLGLGLWSILERSAQQVSPPALILIPLLSLGSLVYLLTIKHIGTGVVLDSAILTTALLIGALLVALVQPTMVSAASVLPYVSVFVVAFMAATHFYFNMNPWTMIYLSVPYVVLWFRDWLTFIPNSPRVEAAGLGILGLFPVIYFFVH